MGLNILAKGFKDPDKLGTKHYDENAKWRSDKFESWKPISFSACYMCNSWAVEFELVTTDSPNLSRDNPKSYVSPENLRNCFGSSGRTKRHRSTPPISPWAVLREVEQSELNWMTLSDMWGYFVWHIWNLGMILPWLDNSVEHDKLAFDSVKVGTMSPEHLEIISAY